MAKLTLSQGEQLIIFRRRNNITQDEMANSYELDRNTYGRIERDVERNPRVDIKISDIENFEICFIFRRRSGLTQAECAAKIGISRVWLHEMETGQSNCKRLLTYWRI
jgi:DNA-binding XRE family transcriptional regulator